MLSCTTPAPSPLAPCLVPHLYVGLRLTVPHSTVRHSAHRVPPHPTLAQSHLILFRVEIDSRFLRCGITRCLCLCAGGLAHTLDLVFIGCGAAVIGPDGAAAHRVPRARVVKKDLMAMKNADLKEELEARDEATSGNKSWLRRRLHAAIVREYLDGVTAEEGE